MPPKSIFSSKTMYLNLAAAIVGYVLNHQGLLADWGVSPDAQIIVLAVLNMVNRYFTTRPVTVA